MPQSPVDIKGVRVPPEPQAVLELTYPSFQPRLVHTGWTVEIATPKQSILTLGDRAYNLVQFHFHEPSEHYIEGKRFALEAHFVHKQVEDNSLAVVAVMIDEGQANSLLEKIAKNMPQQEGEAKELSGQINPHELLPSRLDYYRLMGSLTTEPYLEKVLWLVLTDPITASAEQVKQFHQILNDNARPLQPLKNRDIFICRGG